MSTSSQIRFDFQEAKGQAGKLDDVADRLEKLANRSLAEARDALPCYWQGGSASAFQERQNELQKGILRTATQLHQQAANIRTLAQRLYEAEMEALRIAESRTYSKPIR